MNPPLFRLVNQSFSYPGQPVLSELNLSIHPGEKVAIIGPSGSGKTSLIRLLSQQSTVPFALVPQQYGLVKQLSLLHNIYMGQLDQRSTWKNLSTLIWPSRKIKEQIEQLLKPLGLSGFASKQTGKLSGGQQQRVAIGRALYRSANLFLADEPVSAVDSRQASGLIDYIFSRQNTVVLVLHSVDLALEKAERIIGLKSGKLFFDLKPEEVSKSHLAELYQQ